MINKLLFHKKCRYVLWLSFILSIVMAIHVSPVFADDTSPPELLSLDFNPKNIDVSEDPVTVTVTLSISDDLSGFSYGYLYFYSSSNNQNRFVYVSPSNATGDQEYTVSVEFPQQVEEGTWYIRNIFLRDNVTNSLNYNQSDLTALGFPTELEVVSDEDTTPPVLNAFAISPAQTMDVSSGPVGISFSMNITDNSAGFDDGYIRLTSESRGQYHTIHFYSNNVDISGNITTTFQMPQYSEPGTWVVSNISLQDNVTNQMYYSQSQLTVNGFPTTFEIISNPADTTAPVLVDLDFSPVVINTINGSGTLTVTLDVTDDLSGLSNGRIYFYSPSGNQYNNGYFSNTAYYKVDGYDNRYRFTMTFPRYSEYGQWVVRQVYLADNTANNISLTADNLSNAGLPTILSMEGAISSDDMVVGPEGGIIDPEDDDIITLEFPEGAVDEEVEITITQVGYFDPVDINLGTGPGEGDVIVGYDFDPDDLEFDPPVIMTLVVDATGLGMSDEQLESQIRLFLYNETAGIFEPMPGSDVISVFAENGILTYVCYIHHFSIYALILPKAACGDLDYDGDVDGDDRDLFFDAFKTTSGDSAYMADADYDEDGDIDFVDYREWYKCYQASPE